MKFGSGGFGMRGIGHSSDIGLGVASTGELAKTLAIGLTVTLLFCIGLYIGISGLVIALLTLVL